MMKKTFLTKLIAMGLALTTAFSLAACGNSGNTASGNAQPAQTTAASGQDASAAPTTRSDETLTVMLVAEPTMLTALTGLSDAPGGAVMGATGSRLWEFNWDTNSVEMNLATGYDVVDETHYRIHLREDIIFSDGTPITAEDVLYTYTCLKECNNEAMRSVVIDECKAEDEHTLLLVFEKYVPGWEIALSETQCSIYSKASIEAMGGPSACERELPVSAGKYNVVSWTPGENILLERNENYNDKDAIVYYKNIKVMWASDSASRLLAVKSGDADLAQTISVSEAVALASDPAADAAIFNSATNFNLYFNNSGDSPFADKAVREAVMYAVDTEGITALITMGQGHAIQGFVPRENPYYFDYYEGGVHPYDVEKAKELLTAAGYPDGFTCECIVLKANMQAATVIQETLRELGITMNITPMEPGSYVPEAKAGNYDITIGNNSNAFITHDNFNLVNPATVDTVIGGPKITDPVMSDLIAKATSFDAATAEEGWHEIINYLFDNTCLVGLYNKVECIGYNPKLTNVRLIKRDWLDITSVYPKQ